MILTATKNQKIFSKAVDIHPFAIQFIPECFKIQEMCDKPVDTSLFLFNSVPDWYKT